MTDKLEEIQNTAYAEVAGGADSDGVYQRSWTVSSGPTATTKEVVVQVSWNDGSSRHVELQTLLK